MSTPDINSKMMKILFTITIYYYMIIYTYLFSSDWKKLMDEFPKLISNIQTSFLFLFSSNDKKKTHDVIYLYCKNTNYYYLKMTIKIYLLILLCLMDEFPIFLI